MITGIVAGDSRKQNTGLNHILHAIGVRQQAASETAAAAKQSAEAARQMATQAESLRGISLDLAKLAGWRRARLRRRAQRKKPAGQLASRVRDTPKKGVKTRERREN